MAEQAQERTERATPKRLREARERGQVPRSRELSTALLLLAGSGAFLALGGYLAGGLAALTRETLAYDRARALADDAMLIALGDGLIRAVVVLAPVFGLAVLVSLLAPLALGGWALSGRALRFDWQRLDPVRGLGRVFSLRGLTELAKALAKFGVVAALAVWLLLRLAPELVRLGAEPVEQGLTHTASLLGWALLALSAGMLLVAAVDVPFQLWDHARNLRMTRQEVRDELKETEGKPEVRSRIRRLQQEIARRRMMTEVPKADVVVTNPSHYAVALRYDPARMRAPVVVAKGADLIAAQIRRVAAAHGVPFLPAPPLARALYYATELNREIPAGLYVAVARVLAWVYQLKQARPGEHAAAPGAADLPIPPELRRD